jgi:hypothetical protein
MKLHMHVGILELMIHAAYVVLTLFFLRMLAIWLGPDSVWSKALGALVG